MDEQRHEKLYITLPPGHKAAVVAAAQARGTSASALIARMIERAGLLTDQPTLTGIVQDQPKPIREGALARDQVQPMFKKG